MTKFFSKLKKTYFWPIFPIFGAKHVFLENPALLRTTSYRFLPPCKYLEKNNHTIPRQHPDRRMDRRTERPYFIGPFQLQPGVQKHGFNFDDVSKIGYSRPS